VAKSSGISTRESESLDRYLHEIGKEKLITPDDEVRLAKEIQKGSQRAPKPIYDLWFLLLSNIRIKVYHLVI
jgi:DNA-directed RNA polymerase sigma subunit (sigma70/sigma32)